MPIQADKRVVILLQMPIASMGGSGLRVVASRDYGVSYV